MNIDPALEAKKAKTLDWVKRNKKPLIIGAIVITMLTSLARCVVHAETNLALTCGSPGTAVPASCSAGWTWQAPTAGSVIKTQGGSWKLFTVPPSADVITLCSADIPRNSAQSVCPIAKMIFATGDKASTGPAAVVAWTNPTAYVTQSGQPAPGTPTIVELDLYRGTKADGSDLALYLPMKIVGPLITSYTDTKLTPGQWCYALKAIDANTQISDMSRVACKTIDPIAVPPVDPPKPITITGLTVK